MTDEETREQLAMYFQARDSAEQGAGVTWEMIGELGWDLYRKDAEVAMGALRALGWAPAAALGEVRATALEDAADAMPIDLWATYGRVRREALEGIQTWVRERAAKAREGRA